MARRVTPSQLNSMLRQMQQKLRQAEQQHRQAVERANREIRARNQRVTQAVNKYNSDVRVYNARVRANRQRLKNELARLSHQQVTTRLVTLRTSVNVVQTDYERLERAAESHRLGEQYNEILDLAEREAANSAGVMNALLDTKEAESHAVPDSPESPLTPILASISTDFSERWRGALFSLSPRNPDAARHFCTSAREIFTRILEIRAPDQAVDAAIPNCERTPQGTPTRRAKIQYILKQKGVAQTELEAFVESDMSNVIELFKTFNEGTHGSAGKFTLAQLQAIRQRVEDGIMFISKFLH